MTFTSVPEGNHELHSAAMMCSREFLLYNPANNCDLNMEKLMTKVLVQKLDKEMYVITSSALPVSIQNCESSKTDAFNKRY